MMNNKVSLSRKSYEDEVYGLKDKLIEDLKNCNFQTQAEFHALMSRLDSVEKENAFLRYEHRALEKELHLRYDELSFTQKQNSENVNKINKLQAECLRLRSISRCNENPTKKRGHLLDCDRVKELKCLMDDFVEMEKLAIVAMDTPSSFGVDPLSDFSNAIVPFGSTVRDEFRRYLGGDGPGTAMELESVQRLMLEMEKICLNFQVEIKELKSEEGILSLQKEIEILKETNRRNEEQVENQKLINQELETQLYVNKGKLKELVQKVSALEVEMDNKSHSCQELEETCLELHLQMESKQYSESNEVALDNKKFEKHSSLLDQMLSEDGATVKPKPKPKYESFDSMARALAIVPSKSKGKMGFLRKLISRKKKPSSKNTTIYYCK